MAAWLSLCLSQDRKEKKILKAWTSAFLLGFLNKIIIHNFLQKICCNNLLQLDVQKRRGEQWRDWMVPLEAIAQLPAIMTVLAYFLYLFAYLWFVSEKASFTWILLVKRGFVKLTHEIGRSGDRWKEGYYTMTTIPLSFLFFLMLELNSKRFSICKKIQIIIYFSFFFFWT